MHTVKFPTEEGNLQNIGFKKIMQKSARKLLTHYENVPLSHREKAFNEPCEKCPVTNASSSISLKFTICGLWMLPIITQSMFPVPFNN